MKHQIMLTSITYAYKARDLLKSMGISCKIEKTPKELSSCGCGYSILFDADYDSVLRLFMNNNIKMRSI